MNNAATVQAVGSNDSGDVDGNVSGIETGTVKWFKKEKGYGFLKSDNGGEDTFVHVSELKKSSIYNLDDGQKISFQRTAQPGGKITATNLKLVAGFFTQNPKHKVEKDPTLKKGRIGQFSAEKGFGFISCDNNDPDVFVHVKILNEFGVSTENVLNHRVVFRTGPGHKPGTKQATFIKLA